MTAEPSPRQEPSAPSRSELLAMVADQLGRAPSELDPEANLLTEGLESLQMLRLVTRWRRSGLDVSFSVLAREQSVVAWERHLRAVAEESAS
ncbi:phosphopantetheine-binding protein [Nocardia terpenica]|uniref:phosphopantetheine-binding protein n=1 Tax=Nocardia terpenica TaxID=455432 RepID=UPI002FE28AD5